MRSTSNYPSHKPPTDFDESGISEQSRLLAQKLASHMGIENALQISARNQWHGVVAALKKLKIAQTQND
ncbi:MAG: hypothetical protein KUG56_06265 [Kordiimonadaceae bacterium]|nr:hypothetical protein [Kordiimonadaceae bacterium]